MERATILCAKNEATELGEPVFNSDDGQALDMPSKGPDLVVFDSA